MSGQWEDLADELWRYHARWSRGPLRSVLKRLARAGMWLSPTDPAIDAIRRRYGLATP